MFRVEVQSLKQINKLNINNQRFDQTGEKVSTSQTQMNECVIHRQTGIIVNVMPNSIGCTVAHRSA